MLLPRHGAERDRKTSAGNSIFPRALAANPALTILALSLRTADRLLATARS